MPGALISLDDKTSPFIVNLIRQARHPGELMASIAGYLLTSTQRRFERETGPGGAKWPALSRRTANRRIGRRRRGTNNMLRVTNRLYSSLTTHATETTAEVGTNLIYAGPHQFGADIEQFARSQKSHFKRIRGRNRFVKAGTKGAVTRPVTIGKHVVRIPARPYLGFSEADITEIQEIGKDWLEAGR
ncbi:phage virion morphogenesis protein [Rhizobium halophytocola]|uniref:Phage virion morphogenesis protein n=1 Tax=Rhizobium halophytocola TaxID=735519 RepID=A0ABS4E442_9HYPH|nr:phage virion morphogenesis protein [Rhizobium halophytocola]MBP1852688.1 phage virion morphogenesis protein [Rhizobium halophytocola]